MWGNWGSGRFTNLNPHGNGCYDCSVSDCLFVSKTRTSFFNISFLLHWPEIGLTFVIKIRSITAKLKKSIVFFIMYTYVSVWGFVCAWTRCWQNLEEGIHCPRTGVTCSWESAYVGARSQSESSVRAFGGFLFVCFLLLFLRSFAWNTVLFPSCLGTPCRSGCHQTIEIHLSLPPKYWD